MGQTITLNGRAIAVPGPLTVGDWRRLAKDHGITASRVAKGFDDPDAFVGVLAYSLRRADATVTEAELDALTLPEMLALFEAAQAGEAAAPLDRPTSSSSTSSLSSTAGDRASSTP